MRSQSPLSVMALGRVIMSPTSGVARSFGPPMPPAPLGRRNRVVPQHLRRLPYLHLLLGLSRHRVLLQCPEPARFQFPDPWRGLMRRFMSRDRIGPPLIQRHWLGRMRHSVLRLAIRMVGVTVLRVPKGEPIFKPAMNWLWESTSLRMRDGRSGFGTMSSCRSMGSRKVWRMMPTLITCF